MAVWIKLFALLICTILLQVVCAQENADVGIHKALTDNTLEQTFLLNLLLESGLQTRYSTEETDEMYFQYLTTTEHTEYFTLTSQTGNIKTSQLLDRDVICPMLPECQIELNIAVLPNKYFEVIKVFINIEDENDNAPKFPESSVTYPIPETTVPGLISPIVPAQDLDSPANGIIEYRLDDSSGYFELDVRSIDGGSLEVRLMLLTQLDREIEALYYMQIIAIDGGSPTRTGTLSLTIEVLDVNDNHALFELSTYEADVSENFELNRTFMQVIANDFDDGPNGEIRYSFSTDTQRSLGDVFAMNPTSGEISLKLHLDFEQRNSYSLTVIAQDQGMGSIPSNAKVLLNVIDVNDETPEIVLNEELVDGSIPIAENEESPTYVGHISIIDFDSGSNGQVECQIDESDVFQLEELYDKEYKIIAIVPLDREIRSQITVTVTCHDLGEPRLESELEISIQVTDADDNKPMFSHDKYIVNLPENNDVNAIVTQVIARDNDIGVNGQIVYNLQSATQDFAIDEETGVITALRSFDREDQDQYEITVVAMDMGENPQSSSTVVTIYITDTDDQRPVFLPNQEWKFEIREDVPQGSLVGSVVATDADLPPNDNFTYYLDDVYNIDRNFIINPHNGSILTNKLLDRESRAVYELHIIAESVNTPTLRDSMYVEVKLLDVNDNAPIISFPTADSNVVQISNMAPIGAQITRIMAYDIDAGLNGNLSYQIATLDGSDVEHFQIDSVSGTIFVQEQLSAFNDANITVQVLVSDLGTPRRTSVTRLIINVNSSYAYHEPNSQHGSGNNNSPNLIPILIGSICGAIMVTLLVVLVILLLIRQRRPRPKEDTTLWTAQKQTTYSSGTCVDDHMSDDQDGVAKPDQVQIIPDVAQTRSDSPHNSNRDSHGEKDSDSGCFDLSHSDSQSSGESGSHHGSNQQVHPSAKGPSVVQTKCYHPYSHKNPHTTNPPEHQRLPLKISDNYTIMPPEADLQIHNSLAQSQQVGISPNDSLSDDMTIPPPPPPLLGTYPISQATYANRLQTDNRPFPPPPPQAGISKPHHYPRFTDYLQNESRELQQRGHVYRVSNPRKEGVNPNRKTVRFSSDSKNCDTPFSDPPHLNTQRAVPNNYVDCDLLKSIAMHGTQNMGSNQSVPSQGRDSGVSVRGLSALELDSLV